MTRNFVLIGSLSLFVGCASPRPRPTAPPIDTPADSRSSASATRYTERPLTEYQTIVMNQATKLSLARRIFGDLYGRWPSDLAEIRAKTEGIDFEVFAGKAVITPKSGDAENIQIFDGFNTRSVRAVPLIYISVLRSEMQQKSPALRSRFRRPNSCWSGRAAQSSLRVGG